MAICVDPALRFLNEHAYNMIRRPGGLLNPLEVLGRDDALERLGPLHAVLRTSVPPPDPRPPEPASFLNGQRTENIHVSIGIRLLSHLLNGLGNPIRPADLAPLFRAARFLRFHFENATVVGVDPYGLAHCLASAQLNAASTPQRYVSDPNTDIFVVSEVLQSDTVGVSPLDIGNDAVSVDIPALQARIGGSLSVGVSGRRGPIQFRGREPVSFAFKCYRIEQDRRLVTRRLLEGTVLFAPGTLVQVL
jgi:hypothetical protein